MIITISGVPGSGKTSAGRAVAKRLGMRFFSIGELRAKMAEDRGMTIDELNAHGEKDHTTDTDIDEYQKKLGETGDHLVVEGRLSWRFIPRSFKIFLTCDFDEATRRIYLAKQDGDRSDEAHFADAQEARARLEARIASDARRYKTIYGVDYQDPSHYDLVIDTTASKSPEETAEKILGSLNEKKLA
jgi:predicted cytidylate kinase